MGIVARQATWNTLLTIVGMGLGFVNMALLFPRLLTPDEFGLTRLIVSIAVVAAQIAHFGGENTVIRYFPYFRDKVNGHRGLFGLALSVTVGAFIAMWCLGCSMNSSCGGSATAADFINASACWCCRW